MKNLCAAIFSALAVAALSTQANAQDATAGADVFKKCRACHKVGDGAKNGVGPQQNGVIDRAAGSVDGYKYSPLLQASRAAGLVWTEDNVFAYLADPNGFLVKYLTDQGKADQIKGRSKMTFKLADETDRRNVIAYLKTFPAK